jgi:hypothetical protein
MSGAVAHRLARLEDEGVFVVGRVAGVWLVIAGVVMLGVAWGSHGEPSPGESIAVAAIGLAVVAMGVALWSRVGGRS